MVVLIAQLARDRLPAVRARGLEADTARLPAAATAQMEHISGHCRMEPNHTQGLPVEAAAEDSVVFSA